MHPRKNNKCLSLLLPLAFIISTAYAQPTPEVPSPPPIPTPTVPSPSPIPTPTVPSPPPIPTPTPQSIGMPNPATQYCIKIGGTPSTMTVRNGAQRGLCTLADGMTVDSWQLFHQKFDFNADQQNPATQYCVQVGGTPVPIEYNGEQYGLCTLPDGATVNEWELFHRHHHMHRPPPKPRHHHRMHDQGQPHHPLGDRGNPHSRPHHRMPPPKM